MAYVSYAKGFETLLKWLIKLIRQKQVLILIINEWYLWGRLKVTKPIRWLAVFQTKTKNDIVAAGSYVQPSVMQIKPYVKE